MNAPETLLWHGASSRQKDIGLFIVCGLTFWLIIPILIALLVWLERRAEYKLTTQRLQTTRGFFLKRRDSIELYRVRDISYQQPLGHRILGLADIIVYSRDTTHPTMIIEAIENAQAEELFETIRRYVEVERSRKRPLILE